MAGDHVNREVLTPASAPADDDDDRPPLWEDRFAWADLLRDGSGLFVGLFDQWVHAEVWDLDEQRGRLMGELVILEDGRPPRELYHARVDFLSPTWRAAAAAECAGQYELGRGEWHLLIGAICRAVVGAWRAGGAEVLQRRVERAGEGDEAANLFVEGSLFTTAAGLLARNESGVAWLWRGYLPRGGAVLLSARPKTGKTTLAFHLVRALLQGGSFLGLPVHLPAGARVALLCEESEALVADRLRSLGLTSDRLLLAFRHCCRGRSLEDLVRQALDQGAVLVVVDTLAAWAAIEDENAAAEVEAALRPVLSLCQERQAALVLVHHLRKADGPDGTAHRGSGHLVAAVDVALELRRPEGNAPEGRRVLRAVSRFPETPAELVIELRDGRYLALGAGQQALQQHARDAVLGVLPDRDQSPIPFESPDGDSIMARLKSQRIPRTTVHRTLTELVTCGLVERTGEGRRGRPFLYRISLRGLFPPNSPPMRGNESGVSFFPPIYGDESRGNEAQPNGEKMFPSSTHSYTGANAAGGLGPCPVCGTTEEDRELLRRWKAALSALEETPAW